LPNEILNSNKHFELGDDSPSKKIFSLIENTDSKSNMSHLNNKADSVSNRASSMPFGKTMGGRFGSLFKLQKKNLNDEGILAIDEGNMNNSIEKTKSVAMRRRNDDSVETPEETESEKLSTENLQAEY
jgi:hypothetical protein